MKFVIFCWLVWGVELVGKVKMSFIFELFVFEGSTLVVSNGSNKRLLLCAEVELLLSPGFFIEILNQIRIT